MRCRVFWQDTEQLPYHSDAAGQGALGGSTVEGVHDGDWCSGSFQSAEEVEALLSFFGQWRDVAAPEEVLSEVHAHTLGAAHSLHSSTIDGQ